MTPTPSPDTVEPTEAELNLILTIITCGHRKTTLDQVSAALPYLRQHVAAEVARETATLLQQLENQASIIRDACTPANVREERMLRELAELRAYVSELEEQCDSIGLQKAQHATGLTAHKSSPPPPAS